MPEYIVGTKQDLTEEQYDEARKTIEEQGGKIIDTFERTGVSPGFVVEIPEGTVTTFEENEHVEFVESNGVVTTQTSEWRVCDWFKDEMEDYGHNIIDIDIYIYI